jgi:hypothetical protein
MAPLYVTVIADNPETIDGLQEYLRGAGVSSHGARALREVRVVPPATTAVVLFPDELGTEEVVESIGVLRAARPLLLLLIITGAPQRFRAALGPDGCSLPPIVLPKPAFGWTILDAIRAHAQPEPT